MRTFFTRKTQEVNSSSRESVQFAGKVVKEEVIQAIRDEQAVASGGLLESVTLSGLHASTDGYEMTVGSSSPYAIFVEEGVRAGGKQPPTQKIYDWMVVKGMDATESGAYAIGKAIKEHGIPAKRPFEKGTRNAESRLDGELNVIFDITLRKD